MIKHWNRQDMAAAAKSIFGLGWQSKMARAIDDRVVLLAIPADVRSDAVKFGLAPEEARRLGRAMINEADVIDEREIG